MLARRNKNRLIADANAGVSIFLKELPLHFF
jgi:hypothetical protein